MWYTGAEKTHLRGVLHGGEKSGGTGMARSRLGVAGRGLAGGGGADVALRPLAAGQRHGFRDGAGGPFEPGGRRALPKLVLLHRAAGVLPAAAVQAGAAGLSRQLARRPDAGPGPALGAAGGVLSLLCLGRGALEKRPLGGGGAAVPLRLLAALPRGAGRLLLCAHDLCAGEPGPCGAAGASGLAPSHRPHGGGAGAGELCRRPQRGAAADEPLCAAGGGVRPAAVAALFAGAPGRGLGGAAPGAGLCRRPAGLRLLAGGLSGQPPGAGRGLLLSGPERPQLDGPLPHRHPGGVGRFSGPLRLPGGPLAAGGHRGGAPVLPARPAGRGGHPAGRGGGAGAGMAAETGRGAALCPPAGGGHFGGLPRGGWGGLRLHERRRGHQRQLLAAGGAPCHRGGGRGGGSFPPAAARSAPVRGFARGMAGRGRSSISS